MTGKTRHGNMRHNDTREMFSPNVLHRESYKFGLVIDSILGRICQHRNRSLQRVLRNRHVQVALHHASD